MSQEQLSQAVTTTTIDVSHPKELKLAKTIARFPEVIAQILDDLYPHTLCSYVYELCTKFSEFYDNCYCVEKDKESGEVVKVNMSRLLLCEAAAKVLEQSLYILGLETVTKM